jgi:hypothetical protein
VLARTRKPLQAIMLVAQNINPVCPCSLQRSCSGVLSPQPNSVLKYLQGRLCETNDSSCGWLQMENCQPRGERQKMKGSFRYRVWMEDCCRILRVVAHWSCQPTAMARRVILRPRFSTGNSYVSKGEIAYPGSIFWTASGSRKPYLGGK